MKMILLTIAAVVTMLIVPLASFSQAPDLGTAGNFVLFSTNGGITNVGSTILTGNVGTNNGSIGGFGNVNGVMQNANGATASAAGDLLIAYNMLNASIPGFFPAPLLGNGQVLTAGVYSIGESASLNNVLYLDAQGNANAEFVIKINGAFSTAALSEVVLQNNAQACNVFWKVEGLVAMAAGTKMKGNVIANNAAIVMNSGVQLEGRALSTTGAVSADGINGFIPTGCGSALLTGPTAPDLKSISCYALFTANGELTNSGVSYIKGDVGTNTGLTTGFQELNVDGFIHPIPDVSTAAAAADLIVIQTYLNNLTHDIELLYPAQFGNDLELTPHTYLMNSAAILTGTVYLNAQGNANAVFVIKITGALSTSTYAKLILTNGAQAKNVYWKITGAAEINDYSEFKGVIVVNNGAISIKSGTELLGRALTTSGALNTEASTITMQTPCINPTTALNDISATNFALIHHTGQELQIQLSENQATQLYVYNSAGKMMISTVLSQSSTTLNTRFPAGVYFYRLSSEDGSQKGKFIVK